MITHGGKYDKLRSIRNDHERNAQGAEKAGDNFSKEALEVFVMGKISIADKYCPKGNTFWELADADGDADGNGLHIECTYNAKLEIVEYWLNRELVEQDSLIVLLADLYDNEQTEMDIIDHEITEEGHRMYLREHGGEL